MRKLLLLTALCASLFASGCGKTPQTGAANQSAEPVFATTLPDVDGKQQPLAQWQGKVVVLNFWAPWCPPCREEIPDFVKMQEKYRDRGLIFVGVALDEAQNVRSFATEANINYPLLLGDDAAASLSAKIGNSMGGIPFTAIIDRKGVIVATRTGGIDAEELEALVKPLL